MKIQTSAGSFTYNSKEGADYLAKVLPRVVAVDTVKEITVEQSVTIRKASRLFWIIFWIVVFWPLAFVAFCIAGIDRGLVTIPGEYNISLEDGRRFVISGDESYLVEFIDSARKESFLK